MEWNETSSQTFRIAFETSITPGTSCNLPHTRWRAPLDLTRQASTSLSTAPSCPCGSMTVFVIRKAFNFTEYPSARPGGLRSQRLQPWPRAHRLRPPTRRSATLRLTKSAGLTYSHNSSVLLRSAGVRTPWTIQKGLIRVSLTGLIGRVTNFLNSANITGRRHRARGAQNTLASFHGRKKLSIRAVTLFRDGGTIYIPQVSFSTKMYQILW